MQYQYYDLCPPNTGADAFLDDQGEGEGESEEVESDAEEGEDTVEQKVRESSEVRQSTVSTKSKNKSLSNISLKTKSVHKMR